MPARDINDVTMVAKAVSSDTEVPEKGEYFPRTEYLPTRIFANKFSEECAVVRGAVVAKARSGAAGPFDGRSPSTRGAGSTPAPLPSRSRLYISIARCIMFMEKAAMAFHQTADAGKGAGMINSYDLS